MLPFDRLLHLLSLSAFGRRGRSDRRRRRGCDDDGSRRRLQGLLLAGCHHRGGKRVQLLQNRLDSVLLRRGNDRCNSRLDDRLGNDWRLLHDDRGLTLTERDIEQPVGKLPVVADNGYNDNRKGNHDRHEQDYEKDRQPQHPFPGLCLFGIDILLKCLQDGKVVCISRLSEQTDCVRISAIFLCDILAHLFLAYLPYARIDIDFSMNLDYPQPYIQQNLSCA